jgi:hypothetical protein
VGIQNVGLYIEHSVKRLWTTDLAGAFAVAHEVYKPLKASEGRRQRLTVLVGAYRAMALYVDCPIAVITRMNIPIAVATRKHDEYLALWGRAADPRRQPKIRPVSDRHCVPLFAGFGRRQFH